MSQALYRKWRPQVWDEVIGQEHIIKTLKNAIQGNRIGHAYLFGGPRGTGKTTTARLLAKAVNCLAENSADRPCNHCENCIAVNENKFLDLIEIDAASNTSVDDIRDLRDKINLSPSKGKYKVYIIDEVHMLSTAAFNALLKTLEEPPAHAIFILATTEVHKILPTVLSRCQRHEFRRISVKDVVTELEKLVKGEGMQVEPEALTLIARQSTGCMRDAISLLDQLFSTGEKITMDSAQVVLGTATNQSVIDLVSAILAKNSQIGLECIGQSLDAGTDPRQFARQLVEYLRALLLLRMGNAEHVDATQELKSQMMEHAQAFQVHSLLETVRLFNRAATDTYSTWQPSLQLELAFAEAIEEPAPAAMAAVVPATFAAPVGISVQKQVVLPPLTQKPVVQPPAPVVKNVEDVPPPPEPDFPPEAEMQPSAVSGAKQAGAATDSAFFTIMQNWAKIRAQVKARSTTTAALLNSSKPLMVRDGILVLGFYGDVLKSKMETRENLDLTQEVIYQLTGVQLPVQCAVMNRKTGQVSSENEVEEGGMVHTLINLGGQIVHKE